MYNKDYSGCVCSHSYSFILDNFFRKIIQNPDKIVKEFIRPGDRVIDLGCGPGFFSLAMAEMVGPGGEVVSVDLQPEMLEKVDAKAARKGLADRILMHQCAQDDLKLSSTGKADFILACYMVHETPDHEAFFRQVRPLLKPGGRFLVLEPWFHVSKQQFERITRDATAAGFQVLDSSRGKGGRALLLSGE